MWWVAPVEGKWAGVLDHGLPARSESEMVRASVGGVLGIGATWPVPAGLDQQFAVAPGRLGKFCSPLGHVALVATAVDYNAVEP